MARYQQGFRDLYNALGGKPGAPLTDEAPIFGPTTIQCTDNGLMLWFPGAGSHFVGAHDTPWEAEEPAPAQYGQSAVDVGLEYLGLPYRGPVVGEADVYRWPPYGFDCSSFVSFCYRQLGVRLTAYTDAIADETQQVWDPRRGDIILYRYYDDGQPYTRYPHTGLWVGDGRTLECRWPMGVALLWPLNTDRIFTRPAGW